MRLVLQFIFIFFISVLSYAVTLNKELKYDQHTLPIKYSYGKEKREFQLEKINKKLELLAQFENEALVSMERLGVLRNYKNINGEPAAVPGMFVDKYGIAYDTFGNKRYQGIPLYKNSGDLQPARYALDGELISILDIDMNSDRIKIKFLELNDEYYAPKNYVRGLNIKKFNKVIFIDRKNQNIMTLEKSGDSWLIRSLNPASTGRDKPPYSFITPIGAYVLQSKVDKMKYLKDGSETEIEGYAPYASRFTGGVYVHGVPVNLPKTEIIEFSPTLGTQPVSHKCVRTPSSHAKFIYQWGLIFETLIFVID